MHEKITIKDEAGAGSAFSFMIEEGASFRMDELRQAFPGATSLVYTEGEGLDKIVLPSNDGIFKVPHGGWSCSGRQYWAIQGVTGDHEDRRLKRIKEIMSGFASKRPRVGGSSGSSKGEKRKSRETSESRSRDPRFRIGWMHFKSQKFVQVAGKDGGNIRTIHVDGLDLSVDEVITHGKDVFFEGGESVHGRIEDMSLCLGDSRGCEITEFKTLQGTKCNLGSYLKVRGLLACKYTFYLLTKCKDDIIQLPGSGEVGLTSIPAVNDRKTAVKPTTSDSRTTVSPATTDHNTASGHDTAVIPTTSHGNTPTIGDSNTFSPPHLSDTKHMLTAQTSLSGRADGQILSVTYVRERVSVYSGQVSRLKCHGIDGCRELFEEPLASSEDQQRCNPCANGFVVHSVGVGGTEYLRVQYNEEESGSIVCEYPQASAALHQQEDAVCIVHHPSEIWGYDGNVFMIGVITLHHGLNDVIKYDWFKDGNLMLSGYSLPMIVVEYPGEYHCNVTVGNAEPEKSRTVTVVAAGTCRPMTDVPEIALSDLDIDRSARLGAGTFGTVFKGTWLGLAVAVKEISMPRRARNAILKSIEKEIRINTKLRHPNIIQFLGFTKGETSVCLIHEFIDGSNMEDAIFDPTKKEELEIKAPQKVNIASQVLQGIAYMHSLRPVIVHQDIKPGNILIQKSTFLTKLCDFGISRIRSALATTTAVHGHLPDGSPGYMAPECLVGGDRSSTATDVWSVGVTLLEFFCERDAWECDDAVDPIEKIKQLMRAETSPLMESDQLTPEIRSLLTGCVQYNPATRPSALDLLSEMKKLLEI